MKIKKIIFLLTSIFFINFLNADIERPTHYYGEPRHSSGPYIFDVLGSCLILCGKGIVYTSSGVSSQTKRLYRYVGKKSQPVRDSYVNRAINLRSRIKMPRQKNN